MLPCTFAWPLFSAPPACHLSPPCAPPSPRPPPPCSQALLEGISAPAGGAGAALGLEHLTIQFKCAACASPPARPVPGNTCQVRPIFAWLPAGLPACLPACQLRCAVQLARLACCSAHVPWDCCPPAPCVACPRRPWDCRFDRSQPHLEDRGYNALFLQGVRNCWVRNVSVSGGGGGGGREEGGTSMGGGRCSRLIG